MRRVPSRTRLRDALLPGARRRLTLLLAVLVASSVVAAAPAVGDRPVPPTAAQAGRAPVLPLAAGALPEPLVPGGGFSGDVQLVQDGVMRTVRLHVPTTARRPAPLLVALHGWAQPLAAAQEQQGWQALAEREGLVLAWGVGADASWNAGVCCGNAVREGRDDVAYLDRVLEVAAALHPVDPDRVHLTGFSNGAMMAYRYACERPGRVASILGVSGTLTSPCRSRPRVAVMAVHGEDDATVPLRGTPWSAFLRTGLQPTWAVGRALGDPSRTSRTRGVVLEGFGHGWPTSRRGGWDTERRGWAFLSAHPRPADQRG